MKKDTNNEEGIEHIDVNDSVLYNAIKDAKPSDEGDGEEDFMFMDEDDFENKDDDDSQSTENEGDEEEEEESENSEDNQEDDEGGEEDNEEESDLPETSSREAKESFAKLREAKERYKARAAEVEQEVENLRSQIESAPNPEEVEKLKEELNEYKNIVESEHFQQDPAFISEYKNPVNKSYSDVVKWARAGITSDEVIKEAGTAINIMSETTGIAEKETEFLTAASEIADLFENRAFASRFITSAEQWFERSREYNEAIASKEDTQKYLQQKRKEKMDKERKTVSGILESSHSDWERENSGVVKFYKDNPDKFNYSEEISKGMEKANKLFQNFFDTGAVSRELADFVNGGGIIGGVQMQSQGVMLDLIQSNVKLIEAKNKDIEELEEKLEALGGDTRRGSGNSYLNKAKGSSQGADEKTGSVLVGAMKKAMRR